MPDTTQFSPEELARRLADREQLFILDVRNSEDYGEWRIEGPEPPPDHNVPYFFFLEDEEGELAKLPWDAMKGRQIVVVCAKGGASDYVAGLLRDRGVAASNLAGGTLAWRAYLDAQASPGGSGDG